MMKYKFIKNECIILILFILSPTLSIANYCEYVKGTEHCHTGGYYKVPKSTYRVYSCSGRYIEGVDTIGGPNFCTAPVSVFCYDDNGKLLHQAFAGTAIAHISPILERYGDCCGPGEEHNPTTDICEPPEKKKNQGPPCPQ